MLAEDDPERSHVSQMRADTYILDPENATELSRLIIQGQLMTHAMGGVLAEWGNSIPSDCHRILELCCGPGEWARQVASLSPTVDVTGVDISHSMLAYAQTRAQEEHLSNVHFIHGNILQPLQLPDADYDLLNARLLIGVLHNQQWPLFLQDCLRLVRPGGRLRLTESEDFGLSVSPNFARMSKWMIESMWRSDYGLGDPDFSSIQTTMRIPELLAAAGWLDLSKQEHTIDFSAGSPHRDKWIYNLSVTCPLLEGFLVQLGITTAQEFQQTFQGMLAEIEAQDFICVWKFYTISATKPA